MRTGPQVCVNRGVSERGVLEGFVPVKKKKVRVVTVPGW